MILKETLAYYSADAGTALCTFLDATKAFDRVDYCKVSIATSPRHTIDTFTLAIEYVY